MKLSGKTKSDLDKKFQQVLKTPASFDFFVAIYNFVKYIESNSALYDCLSSRIKINREMKIPNKYSYLKQIYQGLEDSNTKSKDDLGHSRYMILGELNQIRNNNFSECNSFWKKRELSRELVKTIYDRLNPVSV